VFDRDTVGEISESDFSKMPLFSICFAQKRYAYASLLIALTSSLPCIGYPFDNGQAILNKENLTHKFDQQYF
jgi:hypothetical protein